MKNMYISIEGPCANACELRNAKCFMLTAFTLNASC